MTERLEKLQLISTALVDAVDSEFAEKLLLEGLCQLCSADFAVLLSPLTLKSWRSTQILTTLKSSTPAPIEISWRASENGVQLRTAVEQVVHQPKRLCCDDPIRAGEYDFSHLRFLEIAEGARVCSCLLLPLFVQNGRLGQIVELIRLEKNQATGGFSREEQLLATILAQQAEAAINRGQNQREQAELFESLIQLIGSVIDEKSPFAGDHCRRVPVLTMMLARAVSANKGPGFKRVYFSDAEFYELEVAAWLHDIGKLITPIHISDKATKLERTLDRFDLVQTRFEILRRDLEIARLRAGKKTGEVEIATTGEDPQQMLEDLRFLADCNCGKKILTEAEIHRVCEIAERYSWIDRQGEERPVLTQDEASNLMVVCGTLTDEERELINHHVISTINMLDMLPFPDALARVSEIAGSHHEAHNGKGFPTGLDSTKMLIQTRILAFADRFESISAGSRPYKKRNSLNQSLQILRELVDEGQVDSDLYRLFIEEKLYETYAIEFLSRDQIDSVDCKVLLADL